MKAIDEIRQGDKVISYDEDLGIYDEKEVLDVYVNETAEVVHLFVGDDKIDCTPGHRFLTEKGWKLASELKEGDCLKTKDGCDLIKDVQCVKLATPIMTYNLNVQGCHTYLIGLSRVIAHNLNCSPLTKGATEKIKYSYRGKEQWAYNTNGKNIYYAVDKTGHGHSRELQVTNCVGLATLIAISI